MVPLIEEEILMFRVDLGRSGRYCDGVSRRSFLKIGVAGMASVGLPGLLRAKEETALRAGTTRNTSVILLWLDGGPSHMDLYDMKPDAPAEYRGIWKPIKTKVPGFDITEMFPKQARVTDKFSMVRSLHHDTGDHFAAGHRMLTAKDLGVSGAGTAQRFPGLGAVASRELGPRLGREGPLKNVRDIVLGQTHLPAPREAGGAYRDVSRSHASG